MIDATIQFDNDTWRILGVGACKDGYYTCHIASTTRFRNQSNGCVPVARRHADVPMELVEAATHRPPGFFQWNHAMRGAFDKGATTSSNGGTEADCPYVDKRQATGNLTWSRGLQTAWLDGFRYDRYGRALASWCAGARP